MDNLLTFTLSVLTGFLAIMNPLSNLPIFLSLVDGADEATKKRVNKKALFTAFAIVITFVILGKFIFEMFGITIPAFKITGGIIMFYVGFQMLESKSSNMQHLPKTSFDENIAISPLAIPILAGPGTIVTAMNFASGATFLHVLIISVIFGVMCLLTYVVFNAGDKIAKKIGENLIAVIGKIMGLIIAIIGTTMAIEGIKISFNLAS